LTTRAFIHRHRQRSDASARIGETQLAWVKEISPNKTRTRAIVVFTHRPLFDLMPQWDWATRDGAQCDRPPHALQERYGVYGHITRSTTTRPATSRIIRRSR